MVRIRTWYDFHLVKLVPYFVSSHVGCHGTLCAAEGRVLCFWVGCLQRFLRSRQVTFKSFGCCVVMSLLKAFLWLLLDLPGRLQLFKWFGECAHWVSLWGMRSGASSFAVLLMPLEILADTHFMRTLIQRYALRDAACSCALIASEESQGHLTVSCVPRPSRPAAAWLCLLLTQSLCVCHSPQGSQAGRLRSSLSRVLSQFLFQGPLCSVPGTGQLAFGSLLAGQSRRVTQVLLRC